MKTIRAGAALLMGLATFHAVPAAADFLDELNEYREKLLDIIVEENYNVLVDPNATRTINFMRPLAEKIFKKHKGKEKGTKIVGTDGIDLLELHTGVIRVNLPEDIHDPDSWGVWAATIHGGKGDDFITMEDWYFYSDAALRVNTALFGGPGDDILIGGPGKDYLVGGPGNDKLHGHVDDDVLIGGSGADTLYSQWGNDLMYGGKGRDTYKIDSRYDTWHSRTVTVMLHGQTDQDVFDVYDEDNYDGTGEMTFLELRDSYIQTGEARWFNSPEAANLPSVKLGGHSYTLDPSALHLEAWRLTDVEDHETTLEVIFLKK